MKNTQKVSIRSEIYAAQDNCLIAITDGRPLPTAQLSLLPPWRAVLIARVAAKAGIGLEQGTLSQLITEAHEVRGPGELGDWWNRAEPS